MSHIEPVHQQNSEIPVIVNRDEFTIELQNYYSGHNKNSKKFEWTNQRIQSVIRLLDEYNTIRSQHGRLTNTHYHHARKYDVMHIGNQKVLIMKRKDISQPVVQIIPSEEYYQKIHDAHIATGHGRRDKIVHALKDKYMVPLCAITIFLNLCKTCLSKKSFPKKGIVVKPLITDDFNRRGQIDLVDFQTSPDQEYKWLLQYQDHLTKFCFLRPLKSKQAKEVAIEILKIFLEIGCPHILQSDNGREFTASVLKEIVSLWSHCKIINGRPRYPQSQGSIERSNQDVKNMIRAWMTDNKSTNWSIGCYFVQFQKNSSYHSTIDRTPYKALFGEDPKLGLSSTYLSNNIISKLENEEDMEKLFEEFNNNEEQNSEYDLGEEEHENVKTINISKLDIQSIEQGKTTIESPEIIILEQINIENNPELPENLAVDKANIVSKPDNNEEAVFLDSKNSINEKHEHLVESIVKENIALENAISPSVQCEIIKERRYFVCNICNKELSGAHSCVKCNKIVHAICGVVAEENEGYGSQLLCNLCVNELNIAQERTQSHINLKRAAEKMKSTSSKKFKDISPGSTVLVEVPKVDRGPLDSKNLVGQVLMKKNELYQVGTAFGIIKDWMPRNAVLSCPNAELLSDIPELSKKRGASPPPPPVVDDDSRSVTPITDPEDEEEICTSIQLKDGADGSTSKSKVIAPKDVSGNKGDVCDNNDTITETTVTIKMECEDHEDSSNYTIVIRDPLSQKEDESTFKQLHSHQPGTSQNQHMQPSTSTEPEIKEEVDEELLDYKSMYYRLLEEVTELRKQNLFNENKALLETNKSLGLEIEKLIQTNQKYATDMQNLVNENQKLIEKNQNLTENLQNLSDKIQELTEKNKESRAKERIDIFTDYIEKIDKLNENIRNLTKENKILTEKNIALNETIQKYSQESRNFKMEKKKHLKFIQRLKSDYSNKLESKCRTIKALRRNVVRLKESNSRLLRCQVVSL